jgi:hypothetical protein
MLVGFMPTRFKSGFNEKLPLKVGCSMSLGMKCTKSQRMVIFNTWTVIRSGTRCILQVLHMVFVGMQIV